MSIEVSGTVAARGPHLGRRNGVVAMRVGGPGLEGERGSPSELVSLNRSMYGHMGEKVIHKHHNTWIKYHLLQTLS